MMITSRRLGGCSGDLWEQSHREFAQQLIVGLGHYGQVPANCFHFAPDAMNFEDDGWLSAPVKMSAGQYGASTVLLRIRRDGDARAVAHGDRRFRLADGDEKARQRFYESVFSGVSAMLDSIEEPTEARQPRIGFAPVEASTKRVQDDDLMS
jgi:hypothetical protein